jgi:hypothetical protein
MSLSEGTTVSCVQKPKEMSVLFFEQRHVVVVLISDTSIKIVCIHHHTLQFVDLGKSSFPETVRIGIIHTCNIARQNALHKRSHRLANNTQTIRRMMKKVIQARIELILIHPYESKLSISKNHPSLNLRPSEELMIRRKLFDLRNLMTEAPCRGRRGLEDSVIFKLYYYKS